MAKRVVIDPSVQHGKPVIEGTRVPVARILAGLAGGMAVTEIANEYGIAEADGRAAIDYARALVDGEAHHPLLGR